jgi:hypothetical protein
MRAPRVCSPAPHDTRRTLPRQHVSAYPSLSTPPSPRARNLALAGHAHAALAALAQALGFLAGRRRCGLIRQLAPRTTTHGALAAATRVLAADAAHRALTSRPNPPAARQSRLHASRRASISSGCCRTALCVLTVNTLGILAFLRLCESVSTFAVASPFLGGVRECPLTAIPSCAACILLLQYVDFAYLKGAADLEAGLSA